MSAAAIIADARESDPLADLEPWLADELRRGMFHLDGFTWRFDPPTDEGFTTTGKIPLLGDAGQDS